MNDSKEYLNKYNGIILEALEDYKKWFEGKGDSDREELIDQAIKDLNDAMETDKTFIPVCHISKDDLRQVLKMNKPLADKIDAMSEEDLIWIADKMNDGMCSSDSYVMALESAFESWSGE
jgi:hypothetical protein